MEINKNRLTGSGDEEYATGSAVSDEKMMPQDMEAFFKHPLVAANQGDNGDALALLHEYQTLYSGHAVRSENSPIQIFDTNFDPKVSTSSGLDPHLNTVFKPQTVDKKGFYKNEPSNSISDSLSHPNKGTIIDPTLPSINILSRSTFPQNPYTPPTPTKCLNSQNVFHSMHNPTSDWKNNVSTRSDLLKSTDMMFKMSNNSLTESSDSYNKLKSKNSFTICNRANDLKLNKVHVSSTPNMETTTAHSNHAAISNIPPQLNQPAFLHQANSIESSAIDMSFQSNAQNLKMADNTSSKFLTSKQFFGDSDLIQMLEKQMPPEQFAQSISMSLNSKNSLKSHPNIPSLPFPLPEVPLGYRLVITHLPITNDQEPDSKHITQLIIDNPIVPQATSLIPEVSLKQTNLMTAGKSRNLENDEFPKKYITSHEPSVRMIENIDTNGRLSSIPKENILTKSLEEANLLPLLTNPPNEASRDETQDFSLNSSLELPSLQKDLNLSSWQTAVQSPEASSPATIPEVPCSPPQKKPSCKGRPNTRWNHITCIPKIDPDNSGFQFYLEAAISTNPKKNEDRVTYLNKSQYYGLVLQHNPAMPEIFSLSQTLRSVVMLVFRERLSVAEEMRAWECWYSRQHSYKQRVLDIDSKNSGVSDGFSKPIFIEEVAHNAASITWNKHTSVKLNLALNCLSTDFSHQKGIRGNPLHIQIDTYEGDSPQLSHRAYCQIKVFCDKGADRKVREEEKKRSKNSEDHEHHEPCDQSYFYSMVDTITPPVLFSPSTSTQLQDAKSPKMTLATKRQSIDILDGQSENKKRSKNDKLLLFVREERNTVFNALVVQQPTLQCLSRAIQEKFLNSSVNVENIYKESKFMKVKVDDVIVSCMADESTFTISFHYHPQSSTESLTSCDVILTEIRVQNDFG